MTQKDELITLVEKYIEKRERLRTVKSLVKLAQGEYEQVQSEVLGFLADETVEPAVRKSVEPLETERESYPTVRVPEAPLEAPTEVETSTAEEPQPKYTVRGRILTLLQDGKPHQMSEIAKTLKLRDNRVTSCLNIMRKQNEIIRVGHGSYMIAEHKKI